MSNVNLQGRIDTAEFLQSSSTYYYNVTCAATDAYSKPSTYRLGSKVEIGRVGDIMNFSCDISGYVRSKPYKDKETQISKIFFESKVFLNVISATPVKV